ncbi:MAG: helix-turn-helix transcriptional regulator, partial [Spirochaetota bacterium]
GRRLASVGVEGGAIAVPNTPTTPQSGIQFVEVDGREYAVSYIRSEVNRWLYVSGTPIEVFFAQSSRIRFLFAGLVLLLLLVGVPIVLLQVFGLSRPIAETSRILRDGVVLSERVGGDPFSFISHSVDELVQRDRALRELLEEQRPLVKGVVLERLFRGDYRTHEEAKANLVHFEIEVPTDSMAVFCILIEGYFDVATPEIIGEFTVKSALIRDELEHVLPDTTLMHTISHVTICVALFIDESGLVVDSGTTAAALIDMVSRQSRALREVRCTVAAGGVAPDLAQVSVCVRRAIEAAERSVPGAVIAENIEGDRGQMGYSYPTDVELALIKAVRGGRADDASRIAAEIHAANFTERTLSREGVRRLYRELEATRAKIVQRLPTDRRIPFDPDTTEIRKRITLLLDHLTRLAHELADADAASNALKASIERFVQENVFNPEMGLKLLAREFNLSEVYLSRIFRTLFGENFHTYVERIRMEQATQLLRSTRLTVEQIADRVGYQSANTFRRVFKRTYGVSPSAYDGSTA